MNPSPEYTFYWLIESAGLPKNVSQICAGNGSDAMCDVYATQVVQNATNLNIYNALISLVTLRYP